MKISRRRVLLSTGGAGLLPLPVIASNDVYLSNAHQDIGQTLLQHYGGNQQLLLVGQHWVEATRPRLTDMFEELSSQETPRSEVSVPLEARLKHNCRADFAAGRTVEVNGWILARTEVLIAGIVYLFNQHS